MANIDSDLLGRKIIDKTSISSVIGNYIEIFKKGNDYKSVCPFHNDSNPSMSISESKKIFKCFSCNASGNAVTFVMKYKGISFIEALKEISESQNIDIGLTEENIKKDNKYYIRKINQCANELYQALLFTEEGKNALTYTITKRKISLEMIQYFQIGYCSNIDYLSEYLAKYNFPIEKIEESNLLTYFKNKKYNFFADRLIFPICDIENNVQGFSGRLLEDDKTKSKYMNSKENSVFKKSELLYNIYNARTSILETKNVYILEGFMDVIALYKIGVKNCVAIMGTNMSDYQINQISALSNPVFNIFMDGDDPGFEATKKITKELLKRGKEVKIIYNETLNDPDELLNDGKVAYLKKIVNNPISVIDYLINKELKDVTQENIKEKLQKIISVIAYESNEINKVSYCNILSKSIVKFNINFDMIIGELNKYKKENKIANKSINEVYSSFNPNDTQINKNVKPEPTIDFGVFDVNEPQSKFNNSKSILSPTRDILIDQFCHIFIRALAYAFMNNKIMEITKNRKIMNEISKLNSTLARLIVQLEEYQEKHNKLPSLDEALILWSKNIGTDSKSVNQYLDLIKSEYNKTKALLQEVTNENIESIIDSLLERVLRLNNKNMGD